MFLQCFFFLFFFFVFYSLFPPFVGLHAEREHTRAQIQSFELNIESRQTLFPTYDAPICGVCMHACGCTADEDIDLILSRGKEKTSEESKKLQVSETSLRNFSLADAKEEMKSLTFEGRTDPLAAISRCSCSKLNLSVLLCLYVCAFACVPVPVPVPVRSRARVPRCLSFAGRDYSAQRGGSSGSSFEFISMPARERKAPAFSYDVNHHIGDRSGVRTSERSGVQACVCVLLILSRTRRPALLVVPSFLVPIAASRLCLSPLLCLAASLVPDEQPPRSAPREFRPPPRFDFQFFDVERLNELEKKQWESEQRLRALRWKRKEAAKEARRAQAAALREEKKAQLLKKQEEVPLAAPVPRPSSAPARVVPCFPL